MIVVRGFERQIPVTPLIMGSQSPQGATTKKVENYLIHLNEVLGRGNFSVVYKAVNCLTSKNMSYSDDLVAVKVIDLSSMRTAALRDLLKSEI
jgi:hypothetical protein